MLKLAFIYTKRPPQSLNYGGQINYFSGSITSTSFGSRVSALSASAASKLINVNFFRKHVVIYDNLG